MNRRLLIRRNHDHTEFHDFDSGIAEAACFLDVDRLHEWTESNRRALDQRRFRVERIHRFIKSVLHDAWTIDRGNHRIERDAVFGGGPEPCFSDRLLAVVIQQQRHRILERDTSRIDDVAHTVWLRGRRKT